MLGLLEYNTYTLARAKDQPLIFYALNIPKQNNLEVNKILKFDLNMHMKYFCDVCFKYNDRGSNLKGLSTGKPNCNF